VVIIFFRVKIHRGSSEVNKVDLLEVFGASAWALKQHVIWLYVAVAISQEVEVSDAIEKLQTDFHGRFEIK
jgi:hypothetical protein